MKKLVKAIPSDADVLQELARKSKRYWGYDDEYMREWKHDQLLTPDFISDNSVFALKHNENIVGFFAFDLSADPIDLKHFWIDPSLTGSGIGKTLFLFALDYLESIQCFEFQVTAEPNAVGFYSKMGGQVIREVHRPELGQTYPVMIVHLKDAKKANSADAKRRAAD